MRVRTLRRAAGLVAAAGRAVAAAAPAADKDKKGKLPESIAEVMKKGHGSKGLVKGIEKATKAASVDWEVVKADAELLKEFGEGLGEMKPEKGGLDSWKKLTDKYKGQTADIHTAVLAKDKAEVAKALKALKDSCAECHNAHQEQ